MATGHTEGPWRTQGWVPTWHYIPVRDARHNLVASLYPDTGHNYTRDEVEANACLIAAAPDLLKAAKIAITMLEAEFGPQITRVNFQVLINAVAKAEERGQSLTEQSCFVCGQPVNPYRDPWYETIAGIRHLSCRPDAESVSAPSGQ